MSTVATTPTASNFILAVAWRSYLNKLVTDPLVTKSITSACLSLVSDIFAKRLSKQSIVKSSLANEFSIGLIVRGPIVHFWHTFLDKVVFKNTNQSSFTIVLAKVVMDQFLFSPFFNALYFYVKGLQNDEPLSETNRKLRRSLLAILKSNWAIWIPVNLISYAFIPLELRVLFGNIVSIGWTAFLIRKVAAASSSSKSSKANLPAKQD